MADTAYGIRWRDDEDRLHLAYYGDIGDLNAHSAELRAAEVSHITMPVPLPDTAGHLADLLNDVVAACEKQAQ